MIKSFWIFFISTIIALLVYFFTDFTEALIIAFLTGIVTMLIAIVVAREHRESK